MPFVAFAAPDGSGWGLAIGTARALDPGLGPEVDGQVEQLMGAAGALASGTVDDVPALIGTLPELPRGSSLRLAVALFADGRVLGLHALRPRRARGHDRDEIEAFVQEDTIPRPVDDPRLSVTFDGAGHPIRVGLEMWLVPAEEDGYDAPRRAIGEVDGPAVELALGAFVAVAHRVRWRSRGEDGRGWFVLVRER